MKLYDVVVFGSGVGGYTAAIRLAQRGLKVATVEKDRIGGECVNYGCVPTKALFTIAKGLSLVRNFGAASINIPSVLKWKKDVARRASEGIEYLLNRYGVDIYRGFGKIVSENEIEVDGTKLRFDKLIIATGSDPKPLPGVEFDGKKIINNRDFAEAEELPNRILVVGAGAIGTELLFILKHLGYEVSAVEAIDVLPGFDKDIVRFVKRRLKAMGIEVRITTVSKIEKRNDELEVHLANGEKIYTDCVLVAIGRVPRSRGIGLEALGVEIDRYGYIKVDQFNRTSNPRIYAVGDVAGPPLLAHKAHVEALIVADAISKNVLWSVDRKRIPIVLFTVPPIASIGLTEEEARKAGLDVKVYRIPLTVSSRAVVEHADDGFMKFVVDAKTNTVVGFHMAGPNAEEVVNLALEIMEKKLELEEVSRRPYAHLSMVEVLKDLVEIVLGEPIHIYIRR